MTVIPPDKLRAYRGTHYRVSSLTNPFVMRVGIPCIEIEALFKENETWSAAFITAFNPRGTMRTGDENAVAHTALVDLLIQAGYRFLDGEGVDPSGAWAPERSLLILGIAPERADEVGTRFGQDAIIFVNEDLIPTVRLLR